jgi:eukaryotic-like serine/threonine-protein kinase
LVRENKLIGLDKDTIEDYKLTKKIGQGGMASVYLAENPNKSPKLVAIKILDRKLDEDNQYIKRFKREAYISSKLNHPNIVKIIKYGKREDINYIIMEYVDGKDLGYFIKNKRKFTIAEILNILFMVCLGLNNAHRIGVIHRDIKPQNLILDKKNYVKITDFGIAKIMSMPNLTTREEQVMGTTFYMSPEQINGKEIDHRTDIYSLGIVAYELLAGVTPYDSETPWEVVKGHLYKTPMPLTKRRKDVPDFLVSIINKCISKKKNERFANVDSLILALKNRKSLEIKNRSTAHLVLVGKNKSYPLDYKEVYIGRKEINHIVIDDMFSSRRHARIKVERAGFILEDLDSRNGTFVNNKRISSHRLKENDVIKIGKTFMQFKIH